MPCGMGKKGEKQDGFREGKTISLEKGKALVGFFPFFPCTVRCLYISFFRLFVLFVKRSGFLFDWSYHQRQAALVAPDYYVDCQYFTERWLSGFLIRLSALQMLIFYAAGLQIRPNEGNGIFFSEAFLFFSLFSHAARHFITLVQCVKFFLTFFTFSQAKRFFILFPIMSQIHPHIGRTFFPIKGEICYFDFVLADGSRQWGTPKLLNS